MPLTDTHLHQSSITMPPIHYQFHQFQYHPSPPPSIPKKMPPIHCKWPNSLPTVKLLEERMLRPGFRCCWCWNPQSPRRRINQITILFRPDLILYNPTNAGRGRDFEVFFFFICVFRSVLFRDVTVSIALYRSQLPSVALYCSLSVSESVLVILRHPTVYPG